ncbi:helix-turn-helix domain-containing protein [Aquimarina mytili]|uniref:Helix-turn-helix transcriptional regulator n=1 Tax=Aquimarina mytili TaxID=874423 RepID=A0A936ZW78_9FLAO|nr:AraC family transcriptional regulator [Aquimarina mytili]MBL0682156.1 helix-turn-helix transcriptional regulator [Aquimarina mytili]
MSYQNIYYNHFDRIKRNDPHMLNKEENFLIRFKTNLPYYKYNESSLTITYFHEGQGNVLVNQRSHYLKKTDFIISNSDSPWEYICNESIQNDILCFAVSDALVSRFINFLSCSTEKLLDTPFDFPEKSPILLENSFNTQHSKLGKFLERVYYLSNHGDFNQVNAIDLTFEMLQVLYDEHIGLYKLLNRIDSKKSSTKKEVFRRLLLVRNYIHDNLSAKITMEELSEISALSDYHIYTSFKNVFGLTPHQYHNKVKLEKAYMLLQNGAFSISDVVALLNFTDLQSFSKLFKKFYGNPPSKF